MRNFQDTLKTRKRSFVSALSICLTVAISSFQVQKVKIAQKSSGMNIKL